VRNGPADCGHDGARSAGDGFIIYLP
jgi:hypothetical protein